GGRACRGRGGTPRAGARRLSRPRIGATMHASTAAIESGEKRQRVPASERRDALIESAVQEFARGGLHGTPVDRIARSVGVAQPYVFALFGSKRELFLAAVERGFEVTEATFTAAAERFDPET